MTKLRHAIRQSLLISAIAFSVVPGIAAAHGDSPHKASATKAVREQKPWGIAGDDGKVQRTIEVRMSDAMRFTPNRLEVKEGETVRFLIHNEGKVMHEFVIGTKAENDAHAQMMLKHPGMEHDEPYMAHVAPGKKGAVVWTFNRAGEFDFACLIAGHYQGGMVGKIIVAKAKQ